MKEYTVSSGGKLLVKRAWDREMMMMMMMMMIIIIIIIITLRYSFGIINWRTEEIKKIDRKTRKMLTM